MINRGNAGIIFSYQSVSRPPAVIKQNKAKEDFYNII
jgi:hypothetical protein